MFEASFAHLTSTTSIVRPMKTVNLIDHQLSAKLEILLEFSCFSY